MPPIVTAARSRAFTLIELLVVVAIIAVLISVLLPSLSGARQQAKMVKCVANLREIGKAMHMYFEEHKNWFPFEKHNYQFGATVHGFYYGGHPGRRVLPGDWWGYTNLNYRDTFKGRPLNRYVASELPDWDVPLTDPTYDTRRDAMTIFQCPSDGGGYWNDQTSQDVEEDLWPLHYRTGSSYDANYQFLWTDGWALTSTLFPSARQEYLQRANHMIQKQLEYHSSTFVILYEDPFDSALYSRIQRRGWHKKWSKHSFLFLDSHAENKFADTRAGTAGTGWKTLAGSNTSASSWFFNNNNPDYRWRLIGPR